jgi:TolA-binding protein
MKRFLFLSLLFLAGLLAVSPAMAQIDSREGIALQNQIYELRQELQQIQQQPPGQSPPPQYQPQPAPPGTSPDSGDTTAQLLVRLSALEEQTRQLQGRVDDLTNQLQRQNDDLTKQIGDLAFKLGQGAPGAAPAPPGNLASSPPPANVAPPPARPPQKRPPEMALREGNAALARRDYAAAAAAAREVLASGNSPRGTDAQLLLARAEHGQHQYQQSAADFFEAYNRAPRAGSAPVALLGVANALIGLNDQKDACQALAKLEVEFPKPAPGIRAAASGARKRAACH